MKKLLLGLLLAAGCAADPNTCATGNWEVALTWGAGSCFEPNTPAGTITVSVTEMEGGYNVALVGAPGTTFSGTVRAEGDACVLSGTFTDLAAGETDTVNFREVGGEITGTGSVNLQNSEVTCGQAFTATGELR